MKHTALNSILEYLTTSVFSALYQPDKFVHFVLLIHTVTTVKLFSLPLGHNNITICFHLTLSQQLRPLASLFSLLSRLSSSLVIFFICLYHHYFSHCQACCCVSKICFHCGYLSPFSCTRVDKYCNLVQKYAYGAAGSCNQLHCVHMCWHLPKGLSAKAAELTTFRMET